MFEFRTRIDGKTIDCRITVQDEYEMRRKGQDMRTPPNAEVFRLDFTGGLRILLQQIGGDGNAETLFAVGTDVNHVLLEMHLGCKCFFAIQYLPNHVRNEKVFRDELLKETKGTLLRESYPPPPPPSKGPGDQHVVY